MVVPLLSKAGYYAVLAVFVLFPQLGADALMGTYFLDLNKKFRKKVTGRVTKIA